MQPACSDLPMSITDIRSVGTLTGPEGYLVKNKKVAAGKSVSNGDVVYYAALEKSATFYTSKKAAQIPDRSPLTPDMQLDADRKYPAWGNYTMKNGKKFILLRSGGYAFPVLNENGFLCSDVIKSDKDGITTVGMPQAWQEVPFEKVEEPVGDGQTVAVAITLKEFDSVSFTLDVAVLVNGKISSRKTVGYDLMSGSADIGGLIVEVAAEGKSAIKINSVTEPADYSVWLKKVFNIDKI